MSIRQDLLAGMIRPEILKLAGRRKLLDKCFNEFLGAVYPGASPDQVREMRICFMAGAAELHAVITYGASPGMQVRDADMAFMEGIQAELEEFHRRTIDTASAGTGQTQ